MLRLLDHPSIDWPVPVLVTVLAWQPTGLLDRLAKVPAEAQRTTFGASATVMSILAGFTVSVMFYFASNDNPTLEQFRDEHGPLLNRSLVGAFISLVFSVMLVIAAILAVPGIIASVFFCGSAALALVKMLRISFLAWGMLQARYRDTRRRPVVVDD